MILAAFLSRSCTLPQSGQTQLRVLSASVFSLKPQSLQVLLEANVRGACQKVRPYQLAL